ncbi:hypothetical protein D3C84_744020 [compost metagenome]
MLLCDFVLGQLLSLLHFGLLLCLSMPGGGNCRVEGVRLPFSIRSHTSAWNSLPLDATHSFTVAAVQLAMYWNQFAACILVLDANIRLVLSSIRPAKHCFEAIRLGRALQCLPRL